MYLYKDQTQTGKRNSKFKTELKYLKKRRKIYDKTRHDDKVATVLRWQQQQHPLYTLDSQIYANDLEEKKETKTLRNMVL